MALEGSSLGLGEESRRARFDAYDYNRQISSLLTLILQLYQMLFLPNRLRQLTKAGSYITL
jgi:hypothetical protein